MEYSRGFPNRVREALYPKQERNDEPPNASANIPATQSPSAEEHSDAVFIELLEPFGADDGVSPREESSTITTPDSELQAAPSPPATTGRTRPLLMNSLGPSSPTISSPATPGFELGIDPQTKFYANLNETRRKDIADRLGNAAISAPSNGTNTSAFPQPQLGLLRPIAP